MENEFKNKEKQFFFICPIDEENTDIRRRTDGIIDAVLIPILKNEFRFQVNIPHRMSNPTMITKEVIEHIVNDQLVIADLTGLNANVMYEIAIRHTTNLPLIIIAEKKTAIPFDISQQRVILYTNDMKGTELLKTNLRETLNSIDNSNEVTNPLKEAIKSSLIKMEVSETKEVSYIIERIDRLEDKLTYFMADSKRDSIDPTELKYSLILKGGSFDNFESFFNELVKTDYYKRGRFSDHSNSVYCTVDSRIQENDLIKFAKEFNCTIQVIKGYKWK